MYKNEHDLKFEMNLSLADVSSQVNIHPQEDSHYMLEIESDIKFRDEIIDANELERNSVVHNKSNVFINDLDDLYSEIVKTVSIAMSLALLKFSHPQTN